MGPLTALALGSLLPYVVHSRCQGGEVRSGSASRVGVFYSPYLVYSPPLGWGEEVGLDLFSELCLMSVSVVWLHFCFL